MVEDNLALFGDERPAPTEETPSAPAAIPDWQIALLRKALDARGLKSMGERKAAIVAAIGRDVDGLRGLTHDEGLRALTNLGPIPTADTSAGSAWDQRDEATWIDNL